MLYRGQLTSIRSLSLPLHHYRLYVAELKRQYFFFNCNYFVITSLHDWVLNIFREKWQTVLNSHEIRYLEHSSQAHAYFNPIYGDFRSKITRWFFQSLECFCGHIIYKCISFFSISSFSFSIFIFPSNSFRLSHFFLFSN